MPFDEIIYIMAFSERMFKANEIYNNYVTLIK